MGTRNESWIGPPFTGAVGRLRWSTSNSCVDRDVASGRVQIWTGNGLPHQVWRVNRDGTLTSSGACLQLSSDAVGNGAPVTAAACSPTAASQRWSRFTNGQLRNVAADRCLDLDSGNTTNGRQLIVWDCVGRPQPDVGGTRRVVLRRW